MKKIIALGIMLLFLGMTISSSTGLYLEKQSTIAPLGGNTLYVGGNGTGNYTSIQDAIDDASDGDTVFVYDDSSPYRENIIIDKSLIMVGENRNTTVILSDNNSDAVNITGANVILVGFTIQTEEDSVNQLNLNADNIQIEYNRFVNITILSSYHNGISIINNIFSNSKWLKRRMIYLFSGNNCIIEGNTISRSNSGIRISNCQDCAIRFNTVHYCSSGISDVSGNSNIINNNTVDVEYDGIFINSNKCLVENNTIFDCFNGIRLYQTFSIRISKNAIFNNEWGIDMYWAHISKITSNNFENNFMADTAVANSFFNRWNQNYWGRPRLFPKIIIIFYGRYTGFEPIEIPWINIDWNPAQEPYDIGV